MGSVSVLARRVGMATMSATQVRTSKTRASVPQVYLQLRIELKWLEPTIWRRVLVPDSITLARLHDVIQTVMGWTDSHLHVFQIGGVYFGNAEPEDDLPWEVLPEQRAKLKKALGARKTFSYLYDFGDSWEHTVKVEAALAPEGSVTGALCVGGAYACPPEDVGGAEGYMGFLEAISNPHHPEHQAMLTWCGGDFDLAAFDMSRINRCLEDVRT